MKKIFKVAHPILIIIFINLINVNLSFGQNKDCYWDNRNKIPCLEIKSNLSNSSEFSKSGTKKKVITKKQIRESGAVDLIDILKSLPNINITQSGPKGQQASMFMRGTGSNHTLVMINGIPINDQSSTQGLHDFGVDFLQTVQQIEVYPGASASHFGANSIGGAINIIMTGDFKDAVSLSTDKSTNYELAGNKTFIYNNSSLNLKIGSIKNETTSAQGNLTDEKDALKNYATNINYENFITDNIRLYKSTYIRQTKAEYDNSFTNQTGYEGNNKMGFINFGLENLDYKKKYNYNFYYNIYNRKYDERGTIDKYKSEVMGFKYDFSKTLNQKLSFGIGSEYKYDWGNFDNDGSYQASTKGHSDNLSLYSNLGLNVFQNSKIALFGRSDNHKHAGKNMTYKFNYEKVFNVSNVGFSFMNGLRNPTLYEMFGTDNYGYSGNKNLKPEKSNTYEIYSNINLKKNLKLSLMAFNSNIKNNIEYKNNKYVNDDDDVDLNQSGINSSISFNKKDNNISLFSSLLSSKKENGSNQLRRPKKNYGLNFSKKLKNNYLGDLNFNLLYNHYGKHLDTHSQNYSTIEMDSTDILDLMIIKKLNNSDIYVKISNLLGESYQRPHGYNQESRTIKFGFKF